MADAEFLAPKLVGRRFNGGHIPLSFFQDFAALERLIVEVAKHKFRSNNPGRKRVPRRFTEGVSLDAVSIGEGSAIPKIVFATAAGLLFAPESHQYFEQSRDAVVEAIGQAQRGEKITALEPKFLEYFQRFGRNLGEEEAVEFPSTKQTTPIVFTKEARRELIRASSPSEDFTDTAVIRGRIVATDTGSRTFWIETIDGPRIQAPLTLPHVDTVFDLERRQLGDRPHSIIYGVAKFDQQSRLKAIESVDDVAELDPLDFTVRIAELAKLKNGWLDGDGIAPSADGLEWLKRSLQAHYPDDLDLPYLYPTEDGGVRAEWTYGRNDLSLEIELNNYTAYWHQLNLDTKVDSEDNFELARDAEWTRLVAKLQEFQGASA